MNFSEREHAVLRITGPENWDRKNFSQSLSDLKWADHDEEIWFECTPRIVSCVTSIAHIILASS